MRDEKSNPTMTESPVSVKNIIQMANLPQKLKNQNQEPLTGNSKTKPKPVVNLHPAMQFFWESMEEGFGETWAWKFGAVGESGHKTWNRWLTGLTERQVRHGVNRVLNADPPVIAQRAKFRHFALSGATSAAHRQFVPALPKTTSKSARWCEVCIANCERKHRQGGQPQTGNVFRVKFYPITPVSKPRMTQCVKWKRTPHQCRYYAFKDRVRLSSVSVPNAGSHIIFVMPMPKSWSKKEKIRLAGTGHQSTPDKDNLEKALLDCIYTEDKQVWDARVTKVWGEIDDKIGGIYIAEQHEAEAVSYFFSKALSPLSQGDFYA